MEKTKKIVEITPEEEAILQKHRAEKVRELEVHLEFLKKQLAELGGHGSESGLAAYPSGFDTDLPLPRKIVVMFKLRGKYMTARDMYHEIIKVQPELKDKPGTYKFYTDISSALGSNATKNPPKLFHRFQPDGASQFLYGLLEWGNGKEAKPEYL